MYTARACERSRVDFDNISEYLSKRSTLSKADIYATLTALSEIIPEYLLNNQSVSLGELGTLSLHFTSACEDKPENVTSKSIKELKVCFRTGKDIKKKMTGASFKKV